MKNKAYIKSFWWIILITFIVLIICSTNTLAKSNQKVYDFAKLLTEEEVLYLERMSDRFSQKRKVDIIVLTTSDTEGKDVVQYMEDFYDKKALGYDKPHGNTAVLTLDMENKEVYIAGFYKGKEYLDDSRCELIRIKITPYLSKGDYYKAIYNFIKLSYKYMGIRPGVNVENILFKLWFKAVISIGIAAVSVLIMAYNSGGKVTTSAATYLDRNNSGIVNRRDTYLKRSVTKRRKPPNKNKTGGGIGMGGGGISKGGHSHSGSRGKF